MPVPNVAEFIEKHIAPFDGYIWDVRYGDYTIGQLNSVQHLGNKLKEDFITPLTDPEVLDTFRVVISRPLLIQSLADFQLQAIAANGGSLPPLPAPQYTLEEALEPDTVFWYLKNDHDRPDWFQLKVRKPPLVKTWDYRLELQVCGI